MRASKNSAETCIAPGGSGEGDAAWRAATVPANTTPARASTVTGERGNIGKNEPLLWTPMRGTGKRTLAAAVAALSAVHLHGFAQEGAGIQFTENVRRIPASSQKPPLTPPPVTVPFTDVKPVATFDIPGDRWMLATADALWIASRETSTLSRVEAKANKIVQSITLSAPPCGAMASAFGSVWVPLCGKGLARVDAKTSAVSLTIDIATPPSSGAVIAAVGSIWTIADDRGALLRIDPESNAAVAEIYTQRGAISMASGADALWIVAPPADAVMRLNPHTNVITETIKVAGSPASIAFADGAPWTLNATASTLTRIDVKANKVAETIALPGSGGGTVVAGAGSVWITRAGLPLARVDPRRNRLVQVFSGTAGGGALLFGHDALWLAATPASVWRLDARFLEAMRPKAAASVARPAARPRSTTGADVR